MKILEKVDTSSWRFNCECRECETKLEVESADLNYRFSDRDGIHPGSGNYSVCCPVCFNHVYVPPGSIPKILQIEAQQRSQRNSSLD